MFLFFFLGGSFQSLIGVDSVIHASGFLHNLNEITRSALIYITLTRVYLLD